MARRKTAFMRVRLSAPIEAARRGSGKARFLRLHRSPQRATAVGRRRAKTVAGAGAGQRRLHSAPRSKERHRGVAEAPPRDEPLGHRDAMSGCARAGVNARSACASPARLLREVERLGQEEGWKRASSTSRRLLEGLKRLASKGCASSGEHAPAHGSTRGRRAKRCVLARCRPMAAASWARSSAGAGPPSAPPRLRRLRRGMIAPLGRVVGRRGGEVRRAPRRGSRVLSIAGRGSRRALPSPAAPRKTKRPGPAIRAPDSAPVRVIAAVATRRAAEEQLARRSGFRAQPATGRTARIARRGVEVRLVSDGGARG